MNELKIKIVDDVLEYNKYVNKEIKKKTFVEFGGIVMTPEVFNKVFSPQRVRLMRFIRNNKMNNIYVIAKKLNKSYEVVYRNIKYLEGIGVLKLDNVNSKVIPRIENNVSVQIV